MDMDMDIHIIMGKPSLSLRGNRATKLGILMSPSNNGVFMK